MQEIFIVVNFLNLRRCCNRHILIVQVHPLRITGQMHVDTLIPIYTLIIISILIIGLIFKTVRIPYIVSYLFVGILLGPHAIGFVQDTSLLKQFETVGLIFLLFFVGMEISLQELLKNWKIPIFGTIIQVILTTGVILLLGIFLEWKLIRVLLISFVITISSTAVVIKLLNEWGQHPGAADRNAFAKKGSTSSIYKIFQRA